MPTVNADPQLLAGFVPMNALSPEHLRQLAGTAAVESRPVGQLLFQEGADDGDTFYVLDGEVQLASKKTGASRVVRSGSDEAQYPLANLKPRQFTGTVKTAASILHVDARLLDTLITWEQVTGIEVMEFDGDASDIVWMRRLLESRALRRLPAASIQQLFARFEELPVKTGQIIIRQGDPGDYYYVIKRGRCRVVRKPGDAQPMVALADLAAGDSFGEEALLSGAPRNATIAALGDGVLLRLAKTDFDRLLKEPALERLTAAETAARIKAGAALLDVRLESEFRRGGLRGSINIPLVQLRQRLGALEHVRRYVVVCDTGRRSAAAAFLLAERGFEVAVMGDGINALLDQEPAHVA